MGQEIVYCFKCNSRLVSSDFDKGAAFWMANRPACKACTWAMAGSERAEERDAARAALVPAPSKAPAPAPKESPTSSSAARMAIPSSAARGSDSKTAPLVIGGIVLVVALVGAAMLSSENGRPAETATHREPAPEPVPIPSPAPAPPKATAPEPPLRVVEPVRPPTEAELKEKKLREERAAALQAVRDQMRGPYLREEFRQAGQVVEQARSRRTEAEWADEIDGILSEIRVAAERLYGPIKDKALDATRRGSRDEVKTQVDRVAKWGLEDLNADLAKAVAAAVPTPPPPPPPPPPPVSPDAGLYAPKWEAAALAAAGRDYVAALASVESALPALKEEAVKAEAAQDAEALRLAQTIPAEVLQLLTKWPADQKIAVKYFDETGAPRAVEGTVARLEASRLILKRGPSTSAIEIGEMTPGTLSALFLERKHKKPQTDARAAAIFCLIEGDPESVPKEVPGAPIPAKYHALARKIAEERVEPASAESRSRALFNAAETAFFSYSTRVEAIQKYKELLKDFADSRFVRRNRASIMNRAESGKEYFFFPGQITAAGTFRSVADPKLETIWTSSADTAKERIKDNFVQLAFSVLPEAAYKCWVYAGGCCAETFTFYCQILEASESPETGSEDAPQVVKHTLSLPARMHSAHPGPKQPTRWAWVAVPLPKFTSAGPRKVRILTNQQGFSICYAMVSSSRSTAPTDAELKKMEKPSGESSLSAGLEAYWKFDDGKGGAAIDSSGKGRNGTLVRNPKWIDGKVGGALHFERDNYVMVPHTDALAFQEADSFTVSLWASAPSPGGGFRSVFAKSRDISPHYGLWVSSSGKWWFGGNQKGIEGSAVTPGWHHVVLLQNGPTHERALYVDGVKCGTGPAADANGGGELRIGAAKSVSEYLTGDIDEVRIYSRALSPAEITLLGQSP